MALNQENFSTRERRFQASLVFASPSLEVVQGACNNFSFPKHTHEDYTIGMVHSGQEKIWHRGVFNHAGKGSLYFYDPDEAHTGAAIDQGGWSYTSAYFSPDFFAKEAGFEFKSGPPTFSNSILNDQHIGQSFLFWIGALQNSLCPMEKQSKLLRFLSLVFERNSSHQMNHATRLNNSRKINLAKDYIRENFHEPIALKEVAAVVDLHPGYLIEAFQKAEGISPHAYLIAKRVNAVRLALLEGLSPSEAAVDCGFYDQSHMTRHFTKTYGLSPAKFQGSHRQLSQLA